MRAAINSSRRAKLPATTHWLQACKQHSKRRGFNTASRVQQTTHRPGSRAKSEWCCAASTVQDVPAAGTAISSIHPPTCRCHSSIAACCSCTLLCTQATRLLLCSALSHEATVIRLLPAPRRHCRNRGPAPTAKLSILSRSQKGTLQVQPLLPQTLQHCHFCIRSLQSANLVSCLTHYIARRSCNCTDLHHCLPYPSWLDQN